MVIKSYPAGEVVFIDCNLKAMPLFSEISPDYRRAYLELFATPMPQSRVTISTELNFFFFARGGQKAPVGKNFGTEAE